VKTKRSAFVAHTAQKNRPTTRQGVGLHAPAYGISSVDSGRVQPSLKVNAPNDRYEREADAVAEQVMRAPAHGPVVQRKCAKCEQEERVQRKVQPGTAAQAAPAALGSQLAQSRGSGKPLPTHTRAQMEQHFGTDFSGVRLHTDPRAIQMSRNLNARAFTHGQDIYFGQGQFAPERPEGRRLLAHELTHVLQQGGGGQFIQRDLAREEPNPGAPAPGLTEEEISAALHYNLNRFANQEEIRLIRDVLGLPRDAEHLIDRDFVLAVAGWQARNNLTIDGKLGADTIRTLVDEYRAEGRLVPEMNTAADRLAIRTRPDERRYNIDVNGHNDLFDAVLSHKNAKLTLVMRIDFRFHAGATGTAPTPAQQRAFIRRFRRDVARVWSEMYALVPVGAVPNNYLDTYFADILIVPSNRNPHYVAHIGSTTGPYVNTDPPSATIGSGGPYVERTNKWVRMGTGDVGLYSGGSVQGINMRQYTAAHEFGHMMGLSHIHCDAGGAAHPNCYGTTNAERANIMGLGNRVTRGNYLPFVVAMRRFTGTRWRAR